LPYLSLVHTIGRDTLSTLQPLPASPAYAVSPGDQIWLNYVNLFIDTIKLDGRLATIAKKHKLDGSIAP